MVFHLETIHFKQSEREDWKRDWRRGNCETFACSQASSFLRRIITAKAKVRPHRFFGEAYVATKLAHEDGWYCSYKWLTSRIWTDERTLPSEFHQEFKQALRKHFPQLCELQARALALANEIGDKPVAPDLWLIRNDEHWFLEVKISPDDIHESQLAGLALIATCLPSAKKIHVGAVYLQDERVEGDPIRKDVQHRFDEYCARLERNKRMEPTRHKPSAADAGVVS